MQRRIVVQQQLAACEALGPARTLLYSFSHGRRELISAAASLMAYQWLKQKMPLPDFLVPLPDSFWQKQKNGFNVNAELAKELSKIFAVPILSILQRKFDWEYVLSHGDFRHRFQRKQKSLTTVNDKHLLLVASTLDDEAFRSAGEELSGDFPKKISALAFAADAEGSYTN